MQQQHNMYEYIFKFIFFSYMCVYIQKSLENICKEFKYYNLNITI